MTHDQSPIRNDPECRVFATDAEQNAWTSAELCRVRMRADRLELVLWQLVDACKRLPASDGRVIGLLPLIERAEKVIDSE